MTWAVFALMIGLLCLYLARYRDHDSEVWSAPAAWLRAGIYFCFCLLVATATGALPATLAGLPRGIDFVFYMAAPGGSDDALYRTAYVDGLSNLLAALERDRQRPRRVFFVSSTAV